MNRLKQVRQLTGITIKELARQTGMHYGSIYNLENGVRKIGSVETRRKLSSALDLPMEAVFPDLQSSCSSKGV